MVLYRIENEEKYKKYIFLNITANKRNDKYTKGVLKLEDLRGINPIDAIPAVLFKDDPDFDLFLSWLNTSCMRHINIIINYQNNESEYTYRNAYYYGKSHPYYSNLGWGQYIGGNQLSMLAVGLYLNKGKEPEKKILQAISNFYDFSLGCNHFGRTFTTGLGHHFLFILLVIIIGGLIIMEYMILFKGLLYILYMEELNIILFLNFIEFMLKETLDIILTV